jgi:putative ABC transport system permease protein
LTAPPAATAARPQYQLVGRLRAEVPFDSAHAAVTAMTPRLHEITGIIAGRDAALDRLNNINQRDRQPIWIMFGAVILVLAIACANVANLALAVGARRQREFAVCLALGASRLRLAGQLLMESLIVGAAGGVAGAWLAYAAVRTLAPLMPPGIAFFNANLIQIDARVLVFAIVITTLTAVLAGLLPAMRNSGTQALDALKSGGRSMTASRFERRTLSAIAIAQCALAVLLLVGASVLMRSFLRLQAVDPGFDAENLAVLKFSAPRLRYADAAAQQALRDQLAGELQSVPGVIGVTVAGGSPPAGAAFYFDVNLETNVADSPVARGLYLAYTPVSPDYFSVMRIPMRAGRGLTLTDGPRTVLIDETFATRYFGSPAAAVGGRFRVDSDEPWHDIVGVVGDVKQMGLDDELGPLEFYYSWNRAGAGWGSHAIVIRTASDPSTFLPTLKQRVWNIDPRLPFSEADDIRGLFNASIARPRFFLTLMMVFAMVAATIAGVGIYSLFSYAVSQRTAEIGIHLAMGATPRRIGLLVLRRGLVLAITGAAFGLAGVWASSRILAGLLFETTATDPVALAVGSLALVLLALVACYIPARRAERVDPLVMLKVE